ncbi:hypothetical protein F0256_12520 [Vibrio europaeus]|nr:hypothetical protein [Vibrio europaeus]
MLWIAQLLFSRSILSVFAVTCLLLISCAALSVQASEQIFEPITPQRLSSENQYQLSPIECPKLQDYSEASAHHCCGSSCLLKLTNSQSISTEQISLLFLAPLGLEAIGKAITRSRTLFRPPIA